MSNAQRPSGAPPFERYRSRLAALHAGDLILAGLPGHAEHPWRITFGRFYPDESPWAVMVAERGPIEVLRVGVRESASPGARYSSEIGWISTGRAVDDPGIGGLAGVLAALDDARIVRYRPGKRCTLSGSVAGRPRFAKVCPDALAYHQDAVALWNQARGGGLGFAVAEPLGADELATTQWQGLVPGSPLDEALLGIDGAELIERLGAALGRLARAPLLPRRVDGPQNQQARTRRAVDRLARRVPDLAGACDTVVSELDLGHEAIEPRRLVPVHGAPHAAQWLIDEDRLGLVDFDRYAAGEPELDLATLLVELEFERRRAVAMVTLRDRVVAGFESEGLPIDQARLDLYCRHKRLAKATRTAWSLRPDGDERARVHLENALNST